MHFSFTDYFGQQERPTPTYGGATDFSSLNKKLQTLSTQKFITKDDDSFSWISSTIHELNDEFSSDIEMIQELFEKVSCSGSISKEEERQFRAIGDSLQHLEQVAVDLDKTLTAKQKKQAKNSFKKVQKIFLEVCFLAEVTQAFNPVVDKLANAHDNLMSVCHQKDPSSLLASTKEVTESAQSFATLVKKIDALNKDEEERNGAGFLYLYQESIRSTMGEFSWSFDEWAKKMKHALEEEISTLSQTYSQKKDPHLREQAARQLWALSAHLGKLEEELTRNEDLIGRLQVGLEKDSSGKIAPLLKETGTCLSEVEGSIQEGRQAIAASREKLRELLKGFDREKVAPLTYGSKEWHKLVSQRVKKQPGLVGRVLSLMSPSQWSDSTKQLVHGLFSGMQLIQNLQGVAKTSEQPQIGSHREFRSMPVTSSESARPLIATGKTQAVVSTLLTSIRLSSSPTSSSLSSDEIEKERLFSILEDKDYEALKTLTQKEGFNPNVFNQKGISALYLAVERMDRHAAHFLLMAGADPKLPNRDSLGRNPWYQAILSDDHYLVWNLGEKVTDLNVLGTVLSEEDSTMHLAITHNKITSLRCLERLGAKLEHVNAFNLTPIEQAIFTKNRDAFKFFLDIGVDVKKPLHSGKLPLAAIVIEQEWTEVFDLLQAERVDFNKPIGGILPIHLVSTEKGIAALARLGVDVDVYNKEELFSILKDRNYDLLEELAKKEGFNANVFDRKGVSLLSMAIDSKDYRAAQILLEAGANPKLQNRDSLERSPWYQAILSDDPKFVSLLGAKVTDLNALGSSLKKKQAIAYRSHLEEDSAVHLAITHHKMQSLRTLKDLGANLDQTNVFNLTPLEHAIYEKNRDAFQFLLTQVDVNKPGQGGKLPLAVAIEQEWTEAFDILQTKGVDFNKPIGGNLPSHLVSTEKGITALAKEGVNLNVYDPDGYTPLHLAALRGKEDAIKALVDLGVDVNQLSCKGEAPLHLAVLGGHEGVVAQLISLKAALDIQDSEGRPALYLASLFGMDNMQQVLIKAGASTRIMDRHRYTPLVGCQMIKPAKDWIEQIKKESYEAESWAQKKLGHKFELSGWTSAWIDLEGGIPTYFADDIAGSLKAFRMLYPEIVSEQEATLLHSLLERSVGSAQSAKQIFDDIEEDLPVVIHTGFTIHSRLGHAVAVSIQGGFLIIANKGAATRKPIEIFTIDPRQLTVEKIQELIDLNEKNQKEYEKWLTSLDSWPNAFGASHNEITKFLEQGYPFAREQRVGNCAWESVETAVYATLILNRIGLGFATREKAENEILLHEANQAFRSWLEFVQLDGLEHYFFHFSEKESLDHDLVSRVFEQLWSQGVSEKFRDKLEELEAFYLSLLDTSDQSAFKTKKVYLGL